VSADAALASRTVGLRQDAQVAVAHPQARRGMLSSKTCHPLDDELGSGGHEVQQVRTRATPPTSRPHMPPTAWNGIYAERVLDLAKLDVDEIATALSDQTDYEHRWLIDPNTGQIAFWTSDTGIDGENPVELDELDLIPIDPLPSHVWYQDMADFAEGLSDERAGQRLARAIRGKGAFRRFKDELYEEHTELVPAWHAFRDVRAKRRAVAWLLDQGLIGDDAVRDFVTSHPYPDLP
jgi:hypothetical protein